MDRAQRRDVARGERLPSTSEHSPAPIGLHDGQELQFVNRAAVRLLGASSDAEITSRPTSDFIHPDALTGVCERMAGLRADGDVSEPAEVALVRIDGSPHAVGG